MQATSVLFHRLGRSDRKGMARQNILCPTESQKVPLRQGHALATWGRGEEGSGQRVDQDWNSFPTICPSQACDIFLPAPCGPLSTYAHPFLSKGYRFPELLHSFIFI